MAVGRTPPSDVGAGCELRSTSIPAGSDATRDEMNYAETVRFFLDEASRFVSPLAVALQWELVFLAALAVWLAPAGWGRRLRPLRAAFGQLANQRARSIALCGLLPVAIRLALLGIYPVPEPSIHDEFSHLL